MFEIPPVVSSCRKVLATALDVLRFVPVLSTKKKKKKKTQHEPLMRSTHRSFPERRKNVRCARSKARTMCHCALREKQERGSRSSTREMITLRLTMDEQDTSARAGMPTGMLDEEVSLSFQYNLEMFQTGVQASLNQSEWFDDVFQLI